VKVTGRCRENQLASVNLENDPYMGDMEEKPEGKGNLQEGDAIGKKKRRRSKKIRRGKEKISMATKGKS